MSFKINNLQFDNYREALDYFESKAIFVDVITHTTVNEILDFEFWLKSWRFRPIKVGEFLSREEGYLASLSLKKIESLNVN